MSPANSRNHASGFEAVTHQAAELLPKDIIMGVWIYCKNFATSKNYAALRHFQKMGFPVIAWVWYDKENNYDYALQAYRDKAIGFTGASYMFTSWRNINMMSLLSPEYAWTPGTPKWNALPYNPEKRMQQLMTPVLPSLSAPGASITIDLRQWCNRSLRDDVASDGKGGWDDRGWLHDLRLAPEGRFTFEGVQFDIIPYARNKGMQCIAVAGKDHVQAGFAQAVKGIKIARKARSLVFLHTSICKSHWGRPADYIVHYADNSTEKIALQVQRNITPAEKPEIFKQYWEKAMFSGYLVGARRAWVGANLSGREIDLQAMEWVNPHPEKEIMFVDMQATRKCERNEIVFLLALTIIQ